MRPGAWKTLKPATQAGNIGGAMTHDAQIVTICRQHGVTALWSADRDLTRFAGVKAINPLVEKSL